MDDILKRLEERDISAWNDAYSCRARGAEAAARIRELEAELDALREARGGRVKPLVWKKEIPSANPSYSPNIAWTEFGLIYANEHAFWFEGEEAVKCQGCRETTKAAAQADYERRILAALEPAPVTVGEAARVLLGGIPNPIFDQLKPVMIDEFYLDFFIVDDDGNKTNHPRVIPWAEIKAIIRAALRALADAGEAGE